jgi:hypothetical protein
MLGREMDSILLATRMAPAVAGELPEKETSMSTWRA